MKFIEVEEGLTINVESISQFEARGAFTKVKTMGGQEFMINMEYSVFKNLMAQTNSIERSMEKNLTQIAANQRYATP